MFAAAAAKSLQSCPTLCNPIDGSPPGSPVPGILQARTLEWVAISFSSAWKWKVKSESEVAQSCRTLSDPMGCSPPGSSVPGILQARALEWVPPPSPSPTATRWLTPRPVFSAQPPHLILQIFVYCVGTWKSIASKGKCVFFVPNIIIN